MKFRSSVEFPFAVKVSVTVRSAPREYPEVVVFVVLPIDSVSVPKVFAPVIVAVPVVRPVIVTVPYVSPPPLKVILVGVEPLKVMGDDAALSVVPVLVPISQLAAMFEA